MIYDGALENLRGAMKSKLGWGGGWVEEGAKRRESIMLSRIKNKIK